MISSQNLKKIFFSKLYCLQERSTVKKHRSVGIKIIKILYQININLELIYPYILKIDFEAKYVTKRATKYQ